MKEFRRVLLLAALLACWGLGGYDLWAPDEPYFGEGAREMVVDGHWAVPHVNGQVTTDKPPLFFWLIALLSLPFGEVTSLTARLPSVLASLGTLWLTMRLGRRFAGERAGTLAGLVLATTYLFWDKSRTAQIDALLCFLVLVALSAFEAFRAGDVRGERAGLLFWFAGALAVLAKGPVGLLLPLGIALVTLAFDRNLSAWKRFAPWTGPAVFLALIGGWIALATIGGGGEYSVWGAFEKHVLSRAVHGMHHKQPPWYYLTVLPVQLLPWSALVPGALFMAWRRRMEPADRFALTHALFVCIFFSIWTEKRDLYVLPAYPAFALLVSRLLTAVSDGREVDAGGAARRVASIPIVLTAALMIVLGCALPFIGHRAQVDVTIGTAALAVALVIGGVAALVLSRRGPVVRPATALALTMAAAYLATATWIFPALDPLKSTRQLALRLRVVADETKARAGEIAALDVGNLVQGLAFYSGGVYTGAVDDADAVIERLAEDGPAAAVVSRSAYDAFPASLRTSLDIVGTSKFSRFEALIVRNRR